MNRLLGILILAGSIVLVGGTIFFAVNWMFANNELSKTRMEKNSIAADLAITESSLQETEAELANTEASLQETEADLADIEANLQETETELADAEASLEETEEELSDAEASLQQIEAELTATEAELADAEADILDLESQVDDLESQVEDCESINNLRHFYSLQELENWLAQDNTDSHTYIEDVFDCDDFALTLQQHAREDGYKIDFQAIYSDDFGYDYAGDFYLYFEYTYYYPGISLLDFDTYHAMNTTIIGNIVYLIEPQSDEVTLFCLID